MKDTKIRVLVVDDSLFMRTLISEMINSDSEFEVIATARNGQEALKHIHMYHPDCVTLDYMLPGVNGLDTLQHIMSESPTPVIMLSAHMAVDADLPNECLKKGAYGFVCKPSGELSLDIAKVKKELLNKIKAATQSKPTKTKSALKKTCKNHTRRLSAIETMIVIGASTGGANVIERILRNLPEKLPVAILLVQHVPSLFFTKVIADQLNNASSWPVEIAEEGAIISPGKVYLAPAEHEMSVVHEKEKILILLTKDAKYRTEGPSIDCTMQSVAEVYGRHTIGVILSGLSRDGTEGMKAIKQAGGHTIVQDETAIVFGMPKVVINEGWAEKVLPAEKIASAIERICRSNKNGS